MEQDLINDMPQNGAHNLCDEECGDGDVHRRLIDPHRTHNMETIVIPFNGLEVNVIGPRHRHGERELVLDFFFLGLDVEILEPDPVYRKEDFFRVMKQNIHFASFIVRIIVILRNPVGAHLGFVVDDRAPHEPVAH